MRPGPGVESSKQAGFSLMQEGGVTQVGVGVGEMIVGAFQKTLWKLLVSSVSEIWLSGSILTAISFLPGTTVKTVPINESCIPFWLLIKFW